MTAKITMKDLPIMLEQMFAAKLPVYLEGGPGGGKSKFAGEYAAMKGPDYGLFELNCATAILPDVVGHTIPVPERYVCEDGETVDITATRFTYPHFWRDKRSGKPMFMFKRGLMLLEEYGQGQSDVKRSLATLMWDRRLGEWVMPEGIDILILSNRSGDRSGVTKDYDFLINRRAQFELIPDFDSWAVWAHENGVNPMIIGFAHAHTQDVFMSSVPKDQGPWTTARSLVSANNYLFSGHALDVKEPLTRQGLAAIMGDGMAFQLIDFIQYRDGLPTLGQILADPENTPVPTGDQSVNKQVFLTYFLAGKVTFDTMPKVVTYMKRLKGDLMVSFFRSCTHRDKKLMSTKAYGDFAHASINLF